VSPPTPAEQDQALASLSGSEVPQNLDADIARLSLIAKARSIGMPWAAVGSALGMDAKTAKATAKRLARDTRRAMLAAQPAEADHGGPYEHVVTGPREERGESPGVIRAREALESGDPQEILRAITEG
jgi:hypothetical protein